MKIFLYISILKIISPNPARYSSFNRKNDVTRFNRGPTFARNSVLRMWVVREDCRRYGGRMWKWKGEKQRGKYGSIFHASTAPLLLEENPTHTLHHSRNLRIASSVHYCDYYKIFGKFHLIHLVTLFWFIYTAFFNFFVFLHIPKFFEIVRMEIRFKNHNKKITRTVIGLK